MTMRLFPALFLVLLAVDQGCTGYSFVMPSRRLAVVVVPSGRSDDGSSSSLSCRTSQRQRRAHSRRTTLITMISDGSDRSELQSLDISKTTYTALVKSPKDAYMAFAEKGMSNAKMHWFKILHQSVLGGCYVGFGGLLALAVAGNLHGIGAANPGLIKMTFAALFPVNLLLILMTGGQLFTGNSAAVAAAKFENMVYWRELWKSFIVSFLGNAIGCFAFAYVAQYSGLLQGGAGSLAISTAIGKCSATFGQTLVKAILCNWMVSLAVFLANASNDMAGKLVGCWFPISTFVAIGLEHSIANLFILPAAMLIGANLTVSQAFLKNLIPVVIGNAIAGIFIVAGSYSYQFGKLGEQSRERFRRYLNRYEIRKMLQKSSSSSARGSSTSNRQQEDLYLGTYE